ncbi:MAG: hypothetical protein GY874_23120 [Desulfobacteraceae bacterium]|nr:hypothetical protein [Desulfobacteraceae bacterium]
MKVTNHSVLLILIKISGLAAVELHDNNNKIKGLRLTIDRRQILDFLEKNSLFSHWFAYS